MVSEFRHCLKCLAGKGEHDFGVETKGRCSKESNVSMPTQFNLKENIQRSLKLVFLWSSLCVGSGDCLSKNNNIVTKRCCKFNQRYLNSRCHLCRFQ